MRRPVRERAARAGSVFVAALGCQLWLLGLADHGAGAQTLPSADLAVTVAVDPGQTPALGQPVNFTLLVTNSGPDAAPTVEVVDHVPAGYTLTGPPTVDDGALSCSTAAGTSDEHCLIDGGLASGATATIHLALTAGTTQTVYNSATVSGFPDSSDPYPYNDYAQGGGITAQGPVADLGLTMEVDPGQTPAPGQPLHLTTRVTNYGPTAAAASVLQIVYAYGLTVDLLAPSSGGCDLATLTCELGTIPAGGSTMVRMTATPPAYGYVQLNAQAFSTTTSECEDVNAYYCHFYGHPSSAYYAANVQAPYADLQVGLALVDPGTPPVGAPFRMVATLTNAGPAEAREAVLYLSAYSGSTLAGLVPSTGTCDASSCRLGTVASGATVTVDVTVTTSCCTFGMQVYGSAPEITDPGGAYANLDGPAGIASDLATTLSIDPGQTPTAGQPLHLTATVTNAGPEAASAVRFLTGPAAGQHNLDLTDLVPATGTCDAAAGSCDLGDLAPGAAVTVAITAAPQRYGSFQLYASVQGSGPGGDPNYGDNSAYLSGPVAGPYLDLYPYGVGSPYINTGRPGSIAYDVRNYGTVAADDVRVVITPPPGTSVVGASVKGHPELGNPCVAGVDDGGNPTQACALGTVAADPTGATFTELLVQLDPGSTPVGTTLHVPAIVSTSTPGDGGYPAATGYLYVTADEATLAYGNLYNRFEPVAIGDIASWQAYFYNQGPGLATNVTVVDVLPPGTTFVSMEAAGNLEGPPACSVDTATNTVTCVFPSLPPYDGYVYVNARIDASHSPGDTLSNSVTVSADQAAPITLGPATTTVKANEVELSVSTHLDSASLPVVVGDSPTVLTDVYVSDTSATGVVLTQTLPPNLAFTSATVQRTGEPAPSPLACTFDGAGGTVTCPLHDIPRYTNTVARLSLSAPAVPVTGLVTVASVAADQPDTYPANDESSLTFDVVEDKADLAVRAFAPATAAVGDVVSFSLEFANAGPGRVHDLVITDALPAQVTDIGVYYGYFFDFTGYHPLDCAVSGQVVTCTAARMGLNGYPYNTVSTYPSTGYISIQAKVATTGDLVNSAHISAATAAPDGTEADDTASTTTAVTDPDLAVTITQVRPTAEVGDPLVYRIGVLNHGGLPAHDVQLSASLPAGDVLSVRGVHDQTGAADDSTGFACEAPSPDLACVAPDIAPRETRYVEVQVVPTATGTVSATATAAALGGEDTSDNQATFSVVVESPTGPNAVRNQPGFVAHTLPGNGPNTSAGPVELPFTIDYFGNVTSGIWINQDGVVSFGSADSSLADPSGTDRRIAVLAGDYYATSAVHSHKVQYGEGTVDGHPAFAVNFVDVGPYPAYYTDYYGYPTNSAQLVIVSRPDQGQGAFDLELNFDHVRYRGPYGFGYAGFGRGDGNPGFLLPGSGTDQIKDDSGDGLIANTLNSGGQLGRYTFNVGYGTTSTDLAASVSMSDSAIAGQTLVAHVTVDNLGPQEGVANVAIPVPTGTTYVGTTGTVGCAVTGPSLACSTPTIAPGGSVAFDVSLAVGSATRGTVTVTPRVSAPGTDPNHANDSATAVATIATSADLLVSYSYDTVDPLVIRPEQTGSDVFYLYNGGPSTANNAKLHLDIPPGLEYLSGAGNGAGGPVACTPAAGGGVDCTFGNLPPNNYYYGSYADISLKGVGAGDQTVTATASSDEPDPDPGNDTGLVTTTVTADEVDLSISLGTTRPAPVVGEAHELNISVYNYGPSVARNVVVIDVVPVNWHVDATTDALHCGVTPNPDGTTTVRCAYGDLGRSDGRNVAIQVTPVTPSATPVTNTATVTSDTTEVTGPGTADNFSSIDSAISPNVADVGVQLQASRATMVVGEPDTFTAYVTNHGPAVVYGLTFTDTLPPELRITGVDGSPPGGTTGGCTTSGQTVSCTYDRLPAGYTVIISVGVVSQVPGSAVANTATVASSATTEPTDATAPNSATATVDVVADTVDTGAASSTDRNPFVVGEPGTLYVSAVNHGPGTARTVSLTDTVPDQLLPTGLAYEYDDDPAANCSLTGQILRCDWVRLPAGSTFGAHVSVDPVAAADGVANTVTIVAADSTEVTGPATAPNTATATFDVKGNVVDLVQSQSSSRTPAVVGEPLSLYLNTVNNGPALARNVHVVDDVPADLGAPTTTDGRCTITGQHVDCAYGDIGRFSGVGTVLDVTPVEDAAGRSPVTNTATASSDTPEVVPDPSPNSASLAQVVSGLVVDLEAFMHLDRPDNVLVLDGAGVFTIGVVNHGPGIAHQTQLVHTLPAQVVPTAAVVTGGTCDVTGQTVTCPLGDVARGAAAQATVTVTAVALSPTDAQGQFVSVGTAVTASSSSPEVTNQHYGNVAGLQLFVIPNEVDLVAAITTIRHGHIGDQQHYSLVVQNGWYGTATGVTLDDAVPPEFRVDSVTAPDGVTCGVSGNAVHCDVASIDRFATVNVDVRGDTGLGGHVHHQHARGVVERAARSRPVQQRGVDHVHREPAADCPPVGEPSPRRLPPPGRRDDPRQRPRRRPVALHRALGRRWERRRALRRRADRQPLLRDQRRLRAPGAGDRRRRGHVRQRHRRRGQHLGRPAHAPDGRRRARPGHHSRRAARRHSRRLGLVARLGHPELRLAGHRPRRL